jgi:hypothetical protein
MVAYLGRHVVGREGVFWIKPDFDYLPITDLLTILFVTVT